jgi:hypothetical protein
MAFRQFVRRLLRGGGLEADHRSRAESRKVSKGVFEEHARAGGPDGYGHVNVERDFKRP